MGAWYASLIKDRSQPSPEVRAKAAELTADSKTDDERARALYRYVSSQVRYIGVAFGIGRYQPHAAGEVLVNQYGDCKDKHTLLAALLAAAGLKAYPALIGSAGELDENVPSPGQFNHVVTALPQEGGYTWLDTTPEVAPFGYLINDLRGKRALVIPSSGSSALVTTPQDPPKPDLQTYSIDATLGDDGTLVGKTSWSFAWDDRAVLMRAALRRTSMAQWRDLAQIVSLRSGFAGEVSDARFDSVMDPEQPLRWTYTYTRKEYSDWANRKISAPLPPLSLPRSASDSSRPVLLGSPSETRMDSAVRLPKDSAPKLPPKREISESFGDYVSESEYADGVLKTRRRLVLKKREVSPEELAKYRAFVAALDADHDSYVALHGAARLTMWNYQEAIWDLPYSDNDEAGKAYDDARAAYDRKDTHAEILALERAIRIDPKFTRARLWLGNVHRTEGNQKTALETYPPRSRTIPRRPSPTRFWRSTSSCRARPMRPSPRGTSSSP